MFAKARFSVAGALAGAVAGAVCRPAVIYIFWLADFTPASGEKSAVLPGVLLISAVIGLLVSGLSGGTGHPLAGAVLGAGAGGFVYLLSFLPLGLFLCVAEYSRVNRGQPSSLSQLPALNSPLGSYLAVALSGFLSGGAGGLVGYRAGRRARRPEEPERRRRAMWEAVIVGVILFLVGLAGMAFVH